LKEALNDFEERTVNHRTELFARKSTGLVRQGRWIDAFIFNSSASWMFGTLIFALSTIVNFGGSDVFSAEGIALIFALAIAGMYAILTSIMPRSGGDYVFNTRIVHPVFGFSFNFSLTVWQLFSAAFTLYFISNVALSPGLEVLGYFDSNQFLIQSGMWLGNPFNSLIFASVVNVLFIYVISTGIRKTFTTLNALWIITLAGTFLMIASLLTSSQKSFQSAFNSFVVAANGTSTSANTFSFVQAAIGAPHFVLATPEIAIVADSVIWVFWMSYIAGEVRHTNERKRNFSAMGGAALLNCIFFLVLVYLLYSRVGVPFISGLTYLSAISPSPLPFTSSLQALSAVLVLSTGNFFAALFVLLAIVLGYSVLLLPALYLQPIRSIFAWSFDRIISEKWSSVSSKFHSPIISTIGVFVIIEAAIVLISFESGVLLGIYSAAVIAPAFSSIFPTAVSAIALRFRARKDRVVQGLIHSKINLITTLGCVSLGFIIFMTYEFLSNESFFFPPFAGLSSSLLIAYNFIFIPLGALIYFASYTARRRKSKININMIASEIPPE
jgi:APA family basic amino acid/polyamine antiporter